MDATCPLLQMGVIVHRLFKQTGLIFFPLAPLQTYLVSVDSISASSNIPLLFESIPASILVPPLAQFTPADSVVVLINAFNPLDPFKIKKHMQFFLSS